MDGFMRLPEKGSRRKGEIEANAESKLFLAARDVNPHES